MPESQSGANRPIVDARLEKLTDDDDIDGTKPNESEFELNIDGLSPGTLQCPEIGKVKIEVNDGAVEPIGQSTTCVTVMFYKQVTMKTKLLK